MSIYNAQKLLRSFLLIWLNFLKKSLMESFIFCAVIVNIMRPVLKVIHFISLVPFYTPWTYQKPSGFLMFWEFLLLKLLLAESSKWCKTRESNILISRYDIPSRCCEKDCLLQDFFIMHLCFKLHVTVDFTAMSCGYIYRKV